MGQQIKAPWPNQATPIHLHIISVRFCATVADLVLCGLITPVLGQEYVPQCMWHKTGNLLPASVAGILILVTYFSCFCSSFVLILQGNVERTEKLVFLNYLC